MRIALLGYGKMGKAIETIALERGHSISARINSSNLWEWENVSLENTDVVIEFSIPQTALENIETCFVKRIPIVVGTTGWYNHKESIKTKVLSEGQSFLYASNFSIGVNLFFKLNEWMAKLMAPYSDYLPSITETHHIHKLDAPSGTAITLANSIIANNARFSEWKLDSEHPDKELNITALRVNEVPGTHVVSYSSVNDDLEITHTANSRKGFAQGAVFAAEWLNGKKGFFNMSDVLNVNLS
jgi:4-hydroxy-tetrahydrodipicolinate reductase